MSTQSAIRVGAFILATVISPSSFGEVPQRRGVALKWFDPAEKVALAVELEGPADPKDYYAEDFDPDQDTECILHWQIGDKQGSFDPDRSIQEVRWSPLRRRIIAAGLDALYEIDPDSPALVEIAKPVKKDGFLYPRIALDDAGRWVFGTVNHYGNGIESAWFALDLKTGRIIPHPTLGVGKVIGWTGAECLFDIGDDLYRVSFDDKGRPTAQVSQDAMQGRSCYWVDTHSGAMVVDVSVEPPQVEWRSSEGERLKESAWALGVTEEGIWVTLEPVEETGSRALLDRATGAELRREPLDDSRFLVRGPGFAHWAERRDGAIIVSGGGWTATFAEPPQP